MKEKTDKEVLESSRFELLKRFSAKDLLFQMQKAASQGLPLNRGGVIDLILLRTLS